MAVQRKTKTAAKTVAFGDVVACLNKTETDPLAAGLERYVGLEHIEPENLHIKSWGDVAEGTSFTKGFRKGQTLFGKRRAYQRKVGYAEFDGICSGDILVFESKDPDVLLPELLPFICQTESFYQYALGTSAGSLSPRTSWAALSKYEFPLPPIEEQRRFAELLWAADEVLERHAQALRICDQLRTAVVQGFLFDESSGTSVAGRWARRPCHELLAVPPRNGISPKANAEGKGFPTLSIGCIRGGAVVAEGNLKYANVSEAKIDSFLLLPQDLLVVRGNGNRDLVGRCGMVTSVPAQCFYPDLLIRLKFRSELLMPEFACVQWNHHVVHEKLLQKAKSTNGIYKINGRDIQSHELIVPPIKEQVRFLRQLSEVKAASIACAEMIDSTRRLSQCLINHLLVGETRLV